MERTPTLLNANTGLSEEGLDATRQILAAAKFAAEKHVAQKRKGAAGEPYLNHLIEVAELVALALTESDTNLIAAALLHDTIEDTDTTRQELEAAFGADVASLVSEVTDDKSLPKSERKRLQIENAPKKSPRAQLLKQADKISNLRAILSSPPADWSYARKKEYFEWAQDVINGLSAGSPALKAEFERTIQRFSEITNP